MDVEQPEPEMERVQAPAPPPPVTRLRQNLVADAEEEPLPRAETLRGYEYAPEKYVVFDKEELRRLRPKTSTEMQIIRSVRLAEIDPVYFETSYFVVPDKGGERAYTLLYTALQKTEHVALAKVAMHGSEHIVLIRPSRRGLMAHTMYYQDEIRAESEFDASGAAAGGKELELAAAFIDAISAPFRPDEFRDTYREQVQELIAGKIDRGETAVSGTAESPAAAPVPDILEALKKSIAMAKKKPMQPAETPQRQKAGKVTEMSPKGKRRKA